MLVPKLAIWTELSIGCDKCAKGEWSQMLSATALSFTHAQWHRKPFEQSGGLEKCELNQVLAETLPANFVSIP